MRKILLTFLIVLLSVEVVAAWGSKGHQVVIAVAQRHLTEKTKQVISNYISYDLKEDAVWMDDYRRTEPIEFTTHWHTAYFDENNHYNPFYLRKTRTGDLVRALDLVENALGNGRYKHLSDEAVVFSIRMLLHFVGDCHCPTHTNIPLTSAKWLCSINGREMTFHSVYDKMPAFVWGKTPVDEIAAQIDNASRRERKQLVKGDIVDWLNEIVKDNVVIYEWNLPETKVLREDTVELSADLVNMQMRNAGYRLAYLLNKYFGE